MKSKWIIIVLAIAIPIAATAGTLSFLKLRKPPVEYRIAPVERGNITAVVTASGTLHPLLTVQVGSQVSGTIKEVYADTESVVKEGQLIAKIDPAPFISRVNAAKANLEIAEAKVSNAAADVTRAEVKVKDTKRTYQRYETLLKDGAVTQEERDVALTNYQLALAEQEAAKARHELSQAELEQAKASLETAELDLSYTSIYSPVDGLVLSRNVDVGQTVAATFQTPTLFLIARDLTEMEAHLDVNEADVGRARPGQPATFYVNAYPREVFNAEVVGVRSSPKVTQNVVTYDVVIGVDNRELKLKPGMTANATITVAESKNSIKIPNAALRFRPPSPEKEKKNASIRQLPGEKRGPEKQVLYTLAGGRKLKAVPVELGISDENFTELIQGDIKEGDKVVVGMTTKAKEPTMPRRLY